MRESDTLKDVVHHVFAERLQQPQTVGGTGAVSGTLLLEGSSITRGQKRVNFVFIIMPGAGNPDAAVNGGRRWVSETTVLCASWGTPMS